MFFEIQADNGIPIYDQVCRQVKFAIARGVLASGDRLPSVRELSKQLLINPNTIARSFQALQQEGIVEPIRGVGFEVATGAKQECRRQRKEIIKDRLSQVLTEAAQSGLEEQEIERLFRQAWSSSQRRSES